MMSNIDSIDPLKIELENVKLEAEADLEVDPLKLDQDLSTPINAVKTEEEISNIDDPHCLGTLAWRKKMFWYGDYYRSQIYAFPD